MYFYWQKEGGQDRWQPALASARSAVVEKHQPRFVTVLDLSRTTEECPPEELDKIKYSGPFYADFDSDDVGLSITQLNKYLDKLEEAGVNLRSAFLYATGGRGFHVEVPMAVFLPKIPKDGVMSLPLIYREMAYRLYVDTLDLRVYSAKRGRMWRTPNIQRDNGKYKVPISLDEARSMTGDLYETLCQAPRRYVPLEQAQDGDISVVPNPHAPAFSHDLALVYAEALIKVNDAAKRRKSAKADVALIQKFKGQLPPTVKAILNGEKLREDAGWNQIAMQLAIVANALGKSHDEIVEQARPLLESHSGDSGRYGTPELRERELRAQLAYTHDNPLYSYSVGALRRLLADGEAAPDLAGITDEAAAKDYEESQALTEGEEEDFTGGLIMGKGGIRQKTAEGEIKTLSRVGFDKVTRITAVEGMVPAGFDVDVYYRGARVTRTLLSLDSLSSRAKLNGFCAATTGGTFQGADSSASYVQEMLMLMANKRRDEEGGGEEFLVRREGIDLIQFPANIDVPEVARSPFPVLGTISGCVVPDRVKEAGLQFRFMGNPNPLGFYKTDLMLAPELANNQRTVGVLTDLMAINKERTLAPMLGWLCAAHARMFYHQHRKQFPLLAISGQAGSGKTTTTRLLLQLHYYKREPYALQAIGSSVYGLTSAVQASASIPAYIDEFKPREMPPNRHGLLLSIFRACYDNGVLTKGGANQTYMSNGREVMETTYSAPTLFLGEATETQTAIVERTVQALFDKAGLYGREASFENVFTNPDVLSSVGRQLAWLLLGVDFEEFCRSFEEDYAEVQRALSAPGNYRIVYNYAVALHGLTLLSSVLHSAGIDLDSRLADLRAAVIGKSDDAGMERIKVAKSEAAKVLSSFSLMSLMDDEPDSTRLFENKDYAFSSVGSIDLIELSLPFCFAKYQEWAKRKGHAALYDNQETFLISMRNFRPYFDSTAGKLTGAPGVVRFRLDQLLEEGVESFKKRG